MSILVAGAGALDRYVATHPQYLFEATPEEARLDPENLDARLQFAQLSIYAGELEESLKQNGFDRVELLRPRELRSSLGLPGGTGGR